MGCNNFKNQSSYRQKQNLKNRKQIKTIGEQVMKTTNNAQKTGRGLIRKMTGRGTAVIISLVLLSWTVGAQNFWDKVLKDYELNRLAMSEIENLSNTDFASFEKAAMVNNSGEATYETIDAELENQVEEYQSSDYVEAEIAAETEKWKNSNIETTETVLTLPVIEYNPDDFVAEELSNEAESNISSSYEELETELALPVLEYNPDQFVDAEMAKENNNQLNNDNETSDKFDASKLEQSLKFNVNKYVEADMAAEIENWLK